MEARLLPSARRHSNPLLAGANRPVSIVTLATPQLHPNAVMPLDLKPRHARGRVAARRPRIPPRTTGVPGHVQQRCHRPMPEQ